MRCFPLVVNHAAKDMWLKRHLLICFCSDIKNKMYKEGNEFGANGYLCSDNEEEEEEEEGENRGSTEDIGEEPSNGQPGGSREDIGGSVAGVQRGGVNETVGIARGVLHEPEVDEEIVILSSSTDDEW